MSAIVKIAVCFALAAWLLLAPGGVVMACCCPCPCHERGMAPPPDRQEMEKRLGAQLDKLVGAGTISAEQSEKTLKFLGDKTKQCLEDFEKMRAMNPEERKIFLNQKRQGPPPDIVADLEKHVGLSAVQAKIVADALRPPGPPPSPR